MLLQTNGSQIEDAVALFFFNISRKARSRTYTPAYIESAVHCHAMKNKIKSQAVNIFFRS